MELTGLLDVTPNDSGFLRPVAGVRTIDDPYVPSYLVRQHHLRAGDVVTVMARPSSRQSGSGPARDSRESRSSRPRSASSLAAYEVLAVEGAPPPVRRPRFDDLTPLFPDRRIRLEGPTRREVLPRVVDLVAPIGFGQRALIVAPPKAGKTTVLKQLTQAIEAHNPNTVVLVLLIDERPEEVTDLRRSVSGTVYSSTFDRPAMEHVRLAELVIERAKRLVEAGRDVVVVLDGITRLARAYNLAAPATGRIMSGGLDSGALYPPKRFFGAARNVEEGGSLTILATALVETGSRMDDVIFEEFKGTGNAEIKLDRRLAERRIYPAIDVVASSTRHEELLATPAQLAQLWKLRRVLVGLSSSSDAAALELLVDKVRTTDSNDDFLAQIAAVPEPRA